MVYVDSGRSIWAVGDSVANNRSLGNQAVPSRCAECGGVG